jgi:hypothetical protein
VQYQRLGLSHLSRALLDQAFAATPTSTHNIACKPLPYVFAPLGLLPQVTRRGSDIVTAMACCAVGEQAELRLWRSGRVMQMVIRVEAAPSSHLDRSLLAALPGRHAATT